jgi:hypothetical protein
MKVQFMGPHIQRKYSRQQGLPYFRLTRPGVFLLFCSLVLLLSGCSLFPTAVQGTNADVTPTPEISPTLVPSPTSTFKSPAITLQTVNCPALSIKWDSLVGTRANVNKVQKVICGNLEGNGATTALVIARYYTPDAKMNFYVYDNLSGTPTRRFAEQGLIQGDALIGPSDTIMTAQLISPDPIPPNVYKEYQWNAATGSFAQIFFNGMYPDITHYQAEQSQALASSTSVNIAQANSWRTSASTILKKLAADIFHWTTTTTQNVSFNSNKNLYIVDVLNQGPGAGGFVSQLLHLDNVASNVFEVISLAPLDGNTHLSSPASGVQLTSPASVSGVSQASGSILGEVLIYDDTFVIVGDSGDIHSPITSGYVNFTQSIKYHLDNPGVQEGLVAFFSTNQNNAQLTNQVAMVKVFLSA